MAGQLSVTIGGKLFACVRVKDADFKDVAAVYVVICVAGDGNWSVLDVGQTGELGDRIDGHDRRGCWEENCPSGNIWVCVYPMPTAQYTRDDRLQFERYLRQMYNPPCGKR